MTSVISLEEFKSLFKQPCKDKIKITMDVTESQFETNTGVTLDLCLDDILKEIYDVAESHVISEEGRGEAL